MKKVLTILTVFVVSMFLFGCGNKVPEKQITYADQQPNKKSNNSINIDFDKLNKETSAHFIHSQTYPLVKNIDCSKIEKNGKEAICFNAIVGDSINKNNLLSLCDSMLRSYGSNASMGTSLAGPKKDYYGEIFDLYDAWVIVVPSSSPKNKTYIMTYIPAGMHTKRSIKVEKDFKN